MIKKIRLIRNRRLTLATLLDELLPVIGDNVVSLHDQFAGADGTPKDITLYRDFYRDVNALARFLIEETGLKRGEPVAIMRTNDVLCFSWFMAAIRAGGIAVPIHPGSPLPELQRIISGCRPRALVTDSTVFSSTIRSTQALPVERWVQADNEPHTIEGFSRISADLFDQPPLPLPNINPDDVVALFHTSGTSGRPKGILLSSEALLGGRVAALAGIVFSHRKSLALFTLPWAHIMAVSTAIYGLMAGLRSCFLDKFDTEKVISIIEQRKVTMFIGVPAMFIKLIDADPPRHRLSSIRLWVSASDSLPAPYRRRLRRYGSLVPLPLFRALGPAFINAYGMVESGGITMFGLETPFLGRQGDLCLPVPPYRVRVADGKGHPIPRGQVGECLVKGPGIVDHYQEGPGDGSSLTDGHGWLKTGDLAVKTRLGFIRIVDRSKDVIKCGGYSVYAKELEAILAEHPAVSNVAVIGVPHPEKGEVPVCVVEPRLGFTLEEDGFLAWCRERIAHHKAPRRAHIAVRGTIPRGLSEKVLKRTLQSYYMNDFIQEKTLPCGSRKGTSEMKTWQHSLIRENMSSYREALSNYHIKNKPIVDTGSGRLAFSLLSPPLGTPAARRRVRNIMKNLSDVKTSIDEQGNVKWGTRTPHFITIAVTYDCQCDCLHCSAYDYRAEVRKNGSALKTPELEKAIRETVDLGTTCVVLTGGEPLLHRDIYNLVEAVDSQKSICTMFTNGEYLDEKTVNRLKEAGLYGIFVSFDFPTADKHDANRKREGIFDRAVKGLELCRNKGIVTGISTYITKEKLASGEVDSMMELARDLNVLEVFFFDIIPTGRLKDEGTCMLDETDFQTVNEFRTKYNTRPDFPRIIHQTMFTSIAYPCAAEGCPAGVSYYHIRANGDVSPCDFTPITYGNVRDGEIGEIWQRMTESDLYSAQSKRCRMSNPEFRERINLPKGQNKRVRS